MRTLVESSPLLSALGLGSIVDQFDDDLRAASPHFAYTNSATQGIMIVDVDRDRELRAQMIELDDVRTPDYSGPSRTERFSVASGSATIVHAAPQ